MTNFKQFYIENNTVGDVFSNGSVDIGSTGNQFPANNDLGYAPGDYRLPFVIGTFRRNGAKLKSRKKRHKSSKHAKRVKAKRKQVGARGR